MLGINEVAMGVDFGVVEWVKHGTLRCYGHVVGVNEDNFVKRSYESRIEGGGVRKTLPMK